METVGEIVGVLTYFVFYGGTSPYEQATLYNTARLMGPQSYTVVCVSVCMCRLLYGRSMINEVQVRASIGF